MKKLLKSARSKFQSLSIRAHNFVEDVKGDLATKIGRASCRERV